jgi:hypothetical protein
MMVLTISRFLFSAGIITDWFGSNFSILWVFDAIDLNLQFYFLFLRDSFNDISQFLFQQKLPIDFDPIFWPVLTQTDAS